MRRALAPLAVALLVAATAVAVRAQGNPPRILAWVETLRGGEERELRWPVAVAASDDGAIAVADAWMPRVLLFRRVGISWQLDGTASLPAAPIGLTHDGERFVAALREAPYLLALEGPRLASRRMPLPAGVVPGAVASLGGGALLLLDLAGSRVLELAASGVVVRETAIDRRVSALTPLPAGGFLAAVGPEARVLRYDTSWNLQAEWELPGDGAEPAWPAALAVEPGGDALVLDRHTGRILVLDASGQLLGVGSRRGWDPGQLYFPAAMARLRDGQVVVADQGNARAQIFRRTDGAGGP